MKKKKFKTYLELVAQYYGLTIEQMFKKTKVRSVSAARHMLYYVCYHNGLDLIDIETYMRQGEFDAPHSNIIHGIKAAAGRIKRIKEDKKFAKKLEQIEFI
jgi:chromosomal replication initiation ATPase DnaA